MNFVPNQTFIADLGLSQRHESDRTLGELTVVPELCPPGVDQARAAVLATIADMAAGSISSAATLPRVNMTLDLSVRILGRATGTITLEARVLKTGRTTTVVETRFWGGRSEDLVALSWATFVASPRPQDVIEMPRLTFTAMGRGRLTTRLEDKVGCRIVAPGVAEIDRTQYVMNPAGTLQGGMLALLAELAVESAAPGVVVSELDVRYLSATRVGPGRATAEILSPGIARVELRDPGNDDRLTAVVLAGF